MPVVNREKLLKFDYLNAEIIIDDFQLTGSTWGGGVYSLPILEHGKNLILITGKNNISIRNAVEELCGYMYLPEKSIKIRRQENAY